MAHLLYEPTSPRSDHGILYIYHGQPCNIPIYFEWTGKTAYGKELNIQIDTSCYVIAKIKRDMRDKESVVEYSIPIQNEKNCVMLKIGPEDSLKLKAELTYHLSMTLYDAEGNVVRILLADLPVKILQSGVRI